jgi:hypothetical protein
VGGRGVGSGVEVAGMEVGVVVTAAVQAEVRRKMATSRRVKTGEERSLRTGGLQMRRLLFECYNRLNFCHLQVVFLRILNAVGQVDVPA